MKNWIKLLLPVGLGILAGTMHYQVLHAELQPNGYVCVTRTMNPGDRFDDDCLGRIDLPGNCADLSTTLIPWEERAVLSGWRVTRKLEKGDLVFFRDSSDQRLPLRPNESEIAVRLLEGIIVPANSLRVGAGLLFQVKGSETPKGPPRMVKGEDGAWKPIQPASSTWLGPLRILAIGGDQLHDGRVRDDDSYDRRNLSLAFPRDPETNEFLPWAQRIHDALGGDSDEYIKAVEVCEPYAMQSAIGQDLASTAKQ